MKKRLAARTSATFPSDLWRGIEADRKRRGVPRSLWLQEAAREYLAHQTERELEVRYFAGYEAVPDSDDEGFEAIERAAIADLKGTV